MAFTKTPMDSVEQTEPVFFLYEWNQRNSSLDKDTDSVNVVWDVVPNKTGQGGYFQAIKREGLQTFDTTVIPEAINGLFFWAEGNVIVGVSEDRIQAYFTDGNLSWSIITAAYSDSSKIVGFTNFAYEDGTNVLIVTNGLTIYRITVAGVGTTITDPDRPVFHRPYPVYLDGYLFLADERGNLCNSVLNDPTSWAASDFLAAEAYPDRIVALARHGVYIVAFGTSSIEFFYDAGNPTGTPLARQAASGPRVGYAGGLAAHGENIFFIGQPVNGNATVCMLDTLSVVQLGSPTANRQIEGTIPQNTGDNFSDFPGHFFNINGHSLYVWKGNNLRTYGYDIETKMWTRLETHLSNSVGFNARCSAYVSFPPSGVKPFNVVAFGNTVDANRLYAFRETVYQDAGVNYTVKFVTRNLDFETRRIKFGSRLLLQCDQTPTTSFVNISWTDDDYQTFSTPRPIDVSSTYPHLYALGAFRKRAYKLTYTDNFPMRFQNLELDYIQGQA